MDNNTKTRILNILKKVTGKEVSDIKLDGDLKSQLTLDSIQIVEFFAAIEKELGVELPLKLMTVRSGKAFLELVDEQLKLQ